MIQAPSQVRMGSFDKEPTKICKREHFKFKKSYFFLQPKTIGVDIFKVLMKGGDNGDKIG
jgi:hypothetical protein